MSSLLLIKRTAVLAVVATLLVACAEGGAPDLPETPSRTAGALPSITATIPNLTRPPTRTAAPAETPQPASPTRAAAPADPATGTPPKTESADRGNTAVVAAPPPPVVATPSAVPAAPTTTPAPSATEPTTAPADDSSWVWWVLAVAAVAVALGVSLLRGARRRKEWHEALADAEDDVGWLARSLIPQLRLAGSPDQAAGGWLVGSPRVSATEDQLTALEATAPDVDGRTRARALRDAVRAADKRIGTLFAVGRPDTLQEDLDAVAAELETALAVPQSA
jgi:hypothetical protein